jgi:hypothetical protein
MENLGHLLGPGVPGPAAAGCGEHRTRA